MTRHRPAFQGERFVVFDWEIESLGRMLGKHSDTFDLTEWFFALDRELTLSGEVLPPKTHQWLSERTFAEARRRGLPVATTQELGKLSGRLLNIVERARTK